MATKKTPTKKGRNKTKESKGVSRGTRSEDWEKHIRGSDKSPIEQKKVAGNKLKAKVPMAAKAKAIARSAVKYLKRGGGLPGMVAIGGATYLGDKVVGAMRREKETRSKLERDARNEKKTPTSKPAEKTSSPASDKKYTSEVAGFKKTKAGDYTVYKKGSTGAQSFRDAFASARKAGKSTFEWRGRKYNTKTK